MQHFDLACCLHVLYWRIQIQVRIKTAVASNLLFWFCAVRQYLHHYSFKGYGTFVRCFSVTKIFFIKTNPSATKTGYCKLAWHGWFSLLCPTGRLLNADDVLKPRDMTRNHVSSTEFSGPFDAGGKIYR